jgi:catechol-2,3-dioxygenase
MTTTDPVTTTSPMTGFSHMQMLVGSLAEAERWYTTALGLERLAADEERGYVALRHRASGVVLVLGRRPEGAGAEGQLDHIAFDVPDGAALEEWAVHLTDAGIAHEGVVVERDRPTLHLYDPDGIEIELVAPEPRPAR